MSTVLVLEDDDDDDDGWSGEPHPELVRAQRPTPVEVTEVAALFGAFPDGSYLTGELMIGECQ